MILVLAAIYTFFKGKDIKDLEAWLDLGGKLRKAIQKLERERLGVRMSEPLAAVYALALVADQYGTEDLELMAITIVPARNGSLSPLARSMFEAHPDRYYVCTIQAPDEKTVVIAINSSGAVIFQNVLTRNHWGYIGT